MSKLTDIDLPDLAAIVQFFLDLIANGPSHETPVADDRWSLVFQEESPLRMLLFKDESVTNSNRYKIIIEMDCKMEDAIAFCTHVEVASFSEETTY